MFVTNVTLNLGPDPEDLVLVLVNLVLVLAVEVFISFFFGFGCFMGGFDLLGNIFYEQRIPGGLSWGSTNFLYPIHDTSE
jgi:hypothetical protein